MAWKNTVRRLFIYRTLVVGLLCSYPNAQAGNPFKKIGEWLGLRKTQTDLVEVKQDPSSRPDQTQKQAPVEEIPLILNELSFTLIENLLSSPDFNGRLTLQNGAPGQFKLGNLTVADLNFQVTSARQGKLPPIYIKRDFIDKPGFIPNFKIDSKIYNPEPYSKINLSYSLDGQVAINSKDGSIVGKILLQPFNTETRKNIDERAFFELKMLIQKMPPVTARVTELGFIISWDDPNRTRLKIESDLMVELPYIDFSRPLINERDVSWKAQPLRLLAVFDTQKSSWTHLTYSYNSAMPLSFNSKQSQDPIQPVMADPELAEEVLQDFETSTPLPNNLPDQSKNQITDLTSIHQLINFGTIKNCRFVSEKSPGWLAKQLKKIGSPHVQYESFLSCLVQHYLKAEVQYPLRGYTELEMSLPRDKAEGIYRRARLRWNPTTNQLNPDYRVHLKSIAGFPYGWFFLPSRKAWMQKNLLDNSATLQFEQAVPLEQFIGSGDGALWSRILSWSTDKKSKLKSIEISSFRHTSIKPWTFYLTINFRDEKDNLLLATVTRSDFDLSVLDQLNSIKDLPNFKPSLSKPYRIEVIVK